MHKQITGKRSSRRKSVRKKSMRFSKVSKRHSKVSKRRSKCNRRSSRKSCRRRSKGKNKHKSYCRRMSGGAEQGRWGGASRVHHLGGGEKETDKTFGGRPKENASPKLGE